MEDKVDLDQIKSMSLTSMINSASSSPTGRHISSEPARSTRTAKVPLLRSGSPSSAASHEMWSSASEQSRDNVTLPCNQIRNFLGLSEHERTENSRGSPFLIANLEDHLKSNAENSPYIKWRNGLNSILSTRICQNRTFYNLSHTFNASFSF